MDTFYSELTFVPDDDLHTRNLLECNLEAIAERPRALECSVVRVGDRASPSWGDDIARKFRQLQSGVRREAKIE